MRSASSLGHAIAKLRRSKGLKQKEVVARVGTRYSDVNAYGRVERGERLPDRDDLVAILIQGLSATSPAEIDSVLALGGYSGLTDTEVQSLKLPQAGSGSSIRKRQQHKLEFWQRLSGSLWRTGSLSFAASVALSLLIATRWLENEILFIMFSCSAYAGLYVISLLLESSFQPDQRGIPAASVFAFCFILFTSVIALSADAHIVRIGSSSGLLVSVLVFIAAAMSQWWVTRTVLAAESVVPTTYPSHTAQAAHLKNTIYFVAIVLIFWAPPAHAIAVLRREATLGHASRARELAARSILMGPDMISLNVNWLMLAFAGMVVYFMISRGKLLDNVMPTANRNRYLTLFYGRVLVYFLLVLGCIGWFAYSLASL